MTDSLGLEVGPGRFRALATAARSVVGEGDAGAARGRRCGRPGRRIPPGAAPVVGPSGPPRELADGGRPGDRRPGTGCSRRRGPPTGSPWDSSSDSPRCPEAAPRRPLAAAARPPPSAATRRSGPCWPWPPAVSAAWSTASAGRSGTAGDGEPSADRSRRDRVLLAAGHLAADLARLALLGEGEVAWVEDGSRAPSLRVSPIDVGPVLAEHLWGRVTGILTSATVPIGLAERLGMPADVTDTLDVGSPFDYRNHSLLYVARSLPDRRKPEAEPAMHDELEVLINAAGGRTLALFTSWRAMRCRRRGAGRPAGRPDPQPVRPAQAGARGSVPLRRVRLPLRHPRVLAGRGRAGSHAQPRHHRPHPVPAARRPGPRGPPRAGRLRRVRGRGPTPGRDTARPGGRAAHPLAAPTAAWWPCSTADWPPPATGALCSSGSRR